MDSTARISLQESGKSMHTQSDRAITRLSEMCLALYADLQAGTSGVGYAAEPVPNRTHQSSTHVSIRPHDLMYCPRLSRAGDERGLRPQHRGCRPKRHGPVIGGDVPLVLAAVAHIGHGALAILDGDRACRTRALSTVRTRLVRRRLRRGHTGSGTCTSRTGGMSVAENP